LPLPRKLNGVRGGVPQVDGWGVGGGFSDVGIGVSEFI